MKKLSIIIPVYNEVHTIHEILKRVVDEKLPSWEKEIIVVDDGSTDGTRKVLKGWEKNVDVVYKEKNEGKGSAMKIGFKRATGDVILIQGCGLNNPKITSILLALFENKKFLLSTGPDSYLRICQKCLSCWGMLITLLQNVLYHANLTDEATGYKVYRKKFLPDGMTFVSKTFWYRAWNYVKDIEEGVSNLWSPFPTFKEIFRRKTDVERWRCM